MKKNKKQNIALASIAAIIVVGVIWYSYSAEQIRQQGFDFGNDLYQIQEDVKRLQVDFNSKITQWDEGDLKKQDLLEYASSHFRELTAMVARYDQLTPPVQFSASVELFKMSTDSQLKSDRHYIEWIKTGQESEKIRSDSLLQQSFDFEMLALGEFSKAKLGYKEYEEDRGKFEAPDLDITKKVDKIWENMREACHLNLSSQEDLDTCLTQADNWRVGHLP